MKTKAKKSLSILLAVIMVLSVFSVIPFTAGAEENAAGVKASALYKSHKIEWESNEDTTFTVEANGKTVDSTITKVQCDDKYYYTALVSVGTNADGKTYTVKKGETAVGSATVSEKTGIDALKKNALVAVDYGENGQYFNGSTVDNREVSAVTVKKLAALTSGSMIYCADGKSASGTQAVMALSDGASGTSGIYVGARNGHSGHVFNSQWKAGFPCYPFNGKHTVAYSVEYGVGFRTAGDGVNGWKDWDTNTGAVLINENTGKVTGVYIGGAKNGNLPFTGTVYFAVVSEETYTNAELKVLTGGVDTSAAFVGGDDIISKTANSDAKNTWAFFGGRVIEGTYADVGGVRNFTRQFEEAIRWQNNTGSGDNVNLTRFVTNLGKTGTSLSDVIAKLDADLADFNPQTSAYMIGTEDYKDSADNSAIDSFKANLTTFITKGLAQRNNTGRVVIQGAYKPADEALAAKAKAYSDAAKAVVEGLDSAVTARVMFVDHYMLTDNDTFAAKLNSEGYPNAYGQLAITLQLCEAIGLSYNITDNNISRELVDAPAVYTEAEISAVANKNNTLTIKSNAFTTGKEYTYKIETASYTVSDTAVYSENGIITASLHENEQYTLTVTTADGATQYTVMQGTVAEGQSAVKKEAELNANQQAVADLMANKDSVTWMFMGDSITHGALHTYGYDSVSQVFEKYIKNDLGRTNDVVLNTAVSSAKGNTTLSDIDARLEMYKPDVVLIQLGMNDSRDNAAYNNFEANLKAIINKAKAKGAIVVLRTSTPKASSTAGDSLEVLVNITRNIATQDGYTDIIIADQYAAFGKMTDYATYLKTGSYAGYILLNNDLHPGANGQILMARATIEALGLDIYNSEVYNHWYKVAHTDVTSPSAPALTTEENTVSVNKAGLQSLYGSELGYVTIKAVDENGTVFTKTCSSDVNAVSLDVLPNGTYQVTVSAELKATSTGVTFASQLVTLNSIEPEPEPDPEPEYVLGNADNDPENNINAGDAVIVLQYFAGIVGEDEINLAAADVNGDTVINASDAAYILQHFASIIDKFPAEK